MIHIVERERITKLHSALKKQQPNACAEALIERTAQAWCLDPEIVREVIKDQQSETEPA